MHFSTNSYNPQLQHTQPATKSIIQPKAGEESEPKNNLRAKLQVEGEKARREKALFNLSFGEGFSEPEVPANKPVISPSFRNDTPVQRLQPAQTPQPRPFQATFANKSLSPSIERPKTPSLKIVPSNISPQPIDRSSLPLIDSMLDSLKGIVEAKEYFLLERVLKEINKLIFKATPEQKLKMKALLAQIRLTPATHFKILNSTLYACKAWKANLETCEHVLSCLIKAQQKVEFLFRVVNSEFQLLTVDLWKDIFERFEQLSHNNPLVNHEDLQRLVDNHWAVSINGNHDYIKFQALCEENNIQFDHENPFCEKFLEEKPSKLSFQPTFAVEHSWPHLTERNAEPQKSFRPQKLFVAPQNFRDTQFGHYVLEREHVEKENSVDFEHRLNELEEHVIKNCLKNKTRDCLYETNQLKRKASPQQVKKFEKLISCFKLDASTPHSLLKVLGDTCHFWEIDLLTRYTILHLLIDGQKSSSKLVQILEKHQKFLTVALWSTAFKEIKSFEDARLPNNNCKSQIQSLLNNSWLRSVHSSEDFLELQAKCTLYGYEFSQTNPFGAKVLHTKTAKFQSDDISTIFNFSKFGEVFRYFNTHKDNLSHPEWCCYFDKLSELMNDKSITLSNARGILSILEFFTKTNTEINGNLVGKLLRLFGKYSKKIEKLENHAAIPLNHLNYFMIDIISENLRDLDSRAIYGVARGIRSIKNSDEINHLLKQLSHLVSHNVEINNLDIQSQAYAGLIHTLGCHAHSSLYPIASIMKFNDFTNAGLVEALHGFAEHAQKTLSTHRSYGLEHLETLVAEIRKRNFKPEQQCFIFIHLAKCSYYDKRLINTMRQLLDSGDVSSALKLHVFLAFTTLGISIPYIQQSVASLIEDALGTFSESPWKKPQVISKPVVQKPAYSTFAMQQLNKKKDNQISFSQPTDISTKETSDGYVNTFRNNIALVFIAAFQFNEDNPHNLIKREYVHFIINNICSDKRLQGLDASSIGMLRQAAVLTDYPKEAYPKKLLDFTHSQTIVSLTQNFVADQLKEKLASPMIKISEEEAAFSYSPVDISIEGITINGNPVVVEVNGPCHRTTNTGVDLGKTIMKRRSLNHAGFHVEEYNFDGLLNADEIEKFVESLANKID